MKRALSLLIILVALVLSVQAVALANSKSDYLSREFPYRDIGGDTYGWPLGIKLFATEINPDLNEIVTLRLECTPGGSVESEKATIRFRIPKGMEIVSGDTLWSGAVKRGQTTVREIVIKPVKRERFMCDAIVDVDGYYTRGGKRYSKSAVGNRIIKIKVKGAPDPRVKGLKEAIEELKKELKEVEEGKVPKDTSEHPPGIRFGPPWLNVAPRLDTKGMEVAPCDSVDQDSLSVLLDSLRQEYRRLWEELYKKKTPGIGKPLKLNESPKGSYDIQAVKESKAKRTQFFKS